MPKVLYFGPKQGPGVFQGVVDSTIGHLRDEQGEEFVTAFVDGCTVSAEGYDDESFDEVFERRLKQVDVPAYSIGRLFSWIHSDWCIADKGCSDVATKCLSPVE